MKLISRTAAFLLLAAVLATAGGGLQAQTVPNMTPAEIEQYNATGVDKWNRVATLYSRTRIGTSSLERGQEIYYMRCWMCHSELITVGDPFPAPSLRDVFERFDAAYVKARVRSGSAGMPTYDPVNLTDKDLDDLVIYMQATCGKLESGSGCFDEHNPPRNPLYKY
jgi:cytochrome c5